MKKFHRIRLFWNLAIFQICIFISDINILLQIIPEWQLAVVACIGNRSHNLLSFGDREVICYTEHDKKGCGLMWKCWSTCMIVNGILDIYLDMDACHKVMTCWASSEHYYTTRSLACENVARSDRMKSTFMRYVYCCCRCEKYTPGHDKCITIHVHLSHRFMS